VELTVPAVDAVDPTCEHVCGHVGVVGDRGVVMFGPTISILDLEVTFLVDGHLGVVVRVVRSLQDQEGVLGLSGQ
jgi:hypothetical protein